MDIPEEEFSLITLKCFLEDQVNTLEHDKASFQRIEDLDLKETENSYGSGSSIYNDSHLCENVSSQTTSSLSKQNIMVKHTSSDHGIDSRELQKQKFIESISSSNTYPTAKRVTRPSLSKLSPVITTVDAREQEKDRLAEIFASSKPSHLSKSPKVTSKNTNSPVCFYNNQPAFSTEETEDKFEKSGKEKSAIPQILVSEYVENQGSKGTLDTMVRVGEFSPLNPSNMGRRAAVGIGEYSEERRKYMLAQRKQEYNEYLQQIRQQSENITPAQDISPHNNKLRTVATQTEWNDESSFFNEEKEIIPRIFTKTSLCSEKDLLTRRLSFTESPIPKCFDDHCEKEVKELLYRQELKNQIEEKNRLKELMRRREEEEEAKIDAKIQRDLEKMRRQYEEERLQRLELAIRRKEQEDMLRQRLAEEQLRAVEESKAKKKQHVRDKSISPNDKACQKSLRYKKSSHYIPLSKSLPVPCASKALSEVNELLRHPHLDVAYDRLRTESVKLSPPERDMPLRKVSAFNQPKNCCSKGSSTAALSPRVQRVNEVEQDTVFEPIVRNGVSSQTENDPLGGMSEETAKKLKEVERMLKEPLITHTDKVLLPISPPLVDASIPPYIPSHQPPPSPPLPTFKRAQRRNSEMLDDKWKVPNSKTNEEKPSDNVFTAHNRSVLTQLGAFRRHLQKERLRMQQRVRDDSP